MPLVSAEGRLSELVAASALQLIASARELRFCLRTFRGSEHIDARNLSHTMYWIALKMLTGDRGKYFAIILGIAFSCVLMAEQSAMFCGIMLRTTSQIRDVRDTDIWVMNPNVRFVEDLKPISDNAYLRVRGVPGVAWAVNFYKGGGQVQLNSGRYQGVMLFGVDDATLVGSPQEMIVGRIGDLQAPDSVIIDEAGYHFLFPGEPVTVGRTMEMNDRRAVIVGVCKASLTFSTQPILFTRFSQARLFVPSSRRMLSFVLARCQNGEAPEMVARRIQEHTGLKALTSEQFTWTTIKYYMRYTGIPINFGSTVLLGFIVGCAISLFADRSPEPAVDSVHVSAPV